MISTTPATARRAPGASTPDRAALPSVRILGSRVDLPDVCAVTAILEDWIRRRGPCRQVVVTGFHGLWEAHRDPRLKAILNAADLWIPDGIAPVLIARIKGVRPVRRTPGAEVMEAFFERAAERGYSSFFLGDTESTLAALRERIGSRYPRHRIAGTLSPPFRALTADEDEEIVRRINEARPDVLWVGLGTPKQDRWIREHKERLDVPVAAGVGAAFRFLSGRVRRAPSWMGDAGLEWLWRLFHEPRKLWRRVFWDGPQFLAHAALDLAGLRRYR
jgi:N-acetylglucosaminyldiphosphoundecaprenol N-acetyl-beta-D-mannosaminyltransferase